jgi:enoyl-CoA hydratase/carnithine racemase
MPALDTMSWEIDGKMGRLVLNRPHVLNAMNNQATIDLNTAADALVREARVRVVVITGAGRSFSTGIDLKQLSSNETNMSYHHRWERALRVFETMEKIVIVGIRGYCLGGGLQLALACDVRIAAESAILGLPAVKEGLIPGLGTYRLCRYVGLGRAKRLILSGESIDAVAAGAMGLVDYVVPSADFDERLSQIARQYLAVCSVATLKSKFLTNVAPEMQYEAFLAQYFEMQDIAQRSSDHREALQAYREKRTPEFQ